MTHYDTLGLEPSATADDIKAAFRRCASKAHPDRAGGSSERMAAVNKAYGVLGDPEKRERYDRTGVDTFFDAQKEAEGLLAQLFDAALTNEADPLQWAHNMTREAKSNTAARSAKLKGQLAHLQKQRGRIKVKSGENMVETIIARRIANIEQEQAKILEANEVHNCITEMLALYEGPAKAPEQQYQQADWQRLATQPSPQGAFNVFGGFQ